MIPPGFVAHYRLLRAIRSIGSVALRLGMATLGLDLLLHGAGLA